MKKSYRVRTKDGAIGAVVEANSARDAKRQIKRQWAWLFNTFGKKPKLIVEHITI